MDLGSPSTCFSPFHQRCDCRSEGISDFGERVFDFWRANAEPSVGEKLNEVGKIELDECRNREADIDIGNVSPAVTRQQAARPGRTPIDVTLSELALECFF